MSYLLRAFSSLYHYRTRVILFTFLFHLTKPHKNAGAVEKKRKKKKNIRSPFYLGRSRSVRRVTNLSSDNYSRRVTRFATFQFPSPSKSINYNCASNYSVRGRRLFVFSRKKKVSLSRRPGLSRCASSVRREHAFLVVSFHPSPRGISHSRLRRALLCAYVIADKAATFHDDR